MSNVVAMHEPNVEEQLRHEGEQLVSLAKSLEVEDDASEDVAATLYAKLKDSIKGVTAYFEGLIKPQRESLQKLYDRKNAHINPREEAAEIVNKKLGSFRQLKEQRALEARREADAKARKLEEDQRLEEAKAAQDAGDTVAAEEIISRPIHVAPVETPVAKPAAISYRSAWMFEVENLALLIRHCAAHPEDSNLLAPNSTAIRSLVTSRKAGMKVPGIRVWEEKTAARKATR